MCYSQYSLHNLKGLGVVGLKVDFLHSFMDMGSLVGTRLETILNYKSDPLSLVKGPLTSEPLNPKP